MFYIASMHSLPVSIVMPVYNSAPWLKQAIDSILNQSYPDFEFIIINDGSTDETDRIIRTYTDKRIRYYQNDGNRGLVYSLNRGLDLSTGKYIARMDGDDISDPVRLEKQVSYMDRHQDADLLATVVELIDEKGHPRGFWKEDHEHLTPDEIRAFMPVNNCIAHPSILAKADILKTFRYRKIQGQAEDYDLWLRLLSAGYQIHKLNDTLLRHRIVPHSFTRLRQRNVFFKLAETKFRFILNECKAGNLNRFTFRTAVSAVSNLLMGSGKSLKQKLGK